MTTRRNILRTIVLAFALVSCDATVESEYSRLRAFLRVTPVTAATPLFEAANNPGIFCKVTQDDAHYIFTRQNGTSTQLNITAVSANYARMKSIYNEGFIVGTPSLPNLSGQFYQVAFDIVCPTATKAPSRKCSRCRARKPYARAAAAPTAWQTTESSRRARKGASSTATAWHMSRRRTCS